MASVERAYLFASRFGTVEFDTAIDETHTTTVATSSHPIERGSPIIDHIIVQPDVLVMTVAHGATPLYARELQGNPLRVTEFYDQLQAEQKAGALLEVVTGVKLYTNMLITSLVGVRNKQLTSVMRFTVTLKEMVIISNAQIDSFNRRFSEATAVDRRAAQAVQRGAVQPEPVSELEDQRYRSILHNGLFD